MTTSRRLSAHVGRVGLVRVRVGVRVGDDRRHCHVRTADLGAMSPQKFSPATTRTTPADAGAVGADVDMQALRPTAAPPLPRTSPLLSA